MIMRFSKKLNFQKKKLKINFIKKNKFFLSLEESIGVVSGFKGTPLPNFQLWQYIFADFPNLFVNLNEFKFL